MLYRLLSTFGFIAHIGDAITSPFRRFRAGNNLVPGTARIPGALIVGTLLVIGATISLAAGSYNDANRDITKYSVSQLSSSTSRGGKDYAAITGTLYHAYVTTSKGGKYVFTYYLLGDGKTWIVVRSSLTHDKMAELVGSDGAVTLSGMLSNDSDAVDFTKSTLADDAPEGIDSELILDQGGTPLPAAPLYAAAAVAGLPGLILLAAWIGTLLVGYVVFRPARSRQSLYFPPGTGFLPVRVTGLVSGYANGRRVREQRAQLQVPATDPSLGPPPIELVWPAGRSTTGIRLTPGTSRVTLGTAFPVGGPRPALKVRFGRYDIVLSFDSEAARDAAFDQFRVTAGLTASPDGLSAARLF